jgi:hypothetical protein
MEMAHTTSVYYPWIEVRDLGWLRTASLYWDSIHTIVPESLPSPYEHADCRLLEEEGVLRPYFVASDLPVVEEIAEDFLTYLESDEAKAILYGARGGLSYIHPKKLSPAVRELARIHPDKLPYEIHHLLRRSMDVHRGQDGWFQMDEPLANYYMTLLAARISNTINASVVTDENSADGLNLVVKAGATLPNPTMFHPDARRWARRGHRYADVPHELAEGALATLALEGIQIDPAVPVGDLLRFRRDNAAELGRFRSAIAKLASEIAEDLPLDAMRQKVWDIYSNELQPSLADLKGALDGRRLGWVAQALLKTSFLSAGSTSLLVTAGLAVPHALLVGAGISLVATGVLYNVEKTQDIRSNPYSFLLRAKRAFGVR